MGLSFDEASARIRLTRSERVGPVTFRQLMGRFGSGQAALAALPELAARGGGRVPKLADAGTVAREMERVDALGARYLFLGEPDYPDLLAESDSAPPCLIVAGESERLERRCVAMVGARNASAAACRFARQLAHDLAEAGVTVVSGLARGIDTAAHIGAGQATVAVVAGGIDHFYPPENEELQRKLSTHALVVTEMPPGVEPRGRHFPRRNRIIAGLSLATVVVEAAPRSGSLITARYANEMGREVLAVPGSPLDPRHSGCNGLIREGATLIQGVADVLEALDPWQTGGVAARRRTSLSVGEEAFELALEPERAYGGGDDGERAGLEELLSHSFAGVDELVRQSRLPAGDVQLFLLELELAGRLERGAGGKVRLSA